jgi:lipoate---protein ligase
MNTDEFIRFLYEVQTTKMENNSFEFNEKDIREIEKSAMEKFQTWEWNFGYSPGYSFKNELEIDGKILKISLRVERGIIIQAEISGNYFLQSLFHSIQNDLLQKKHDFDEVKLVLPSTENHIVYSFFS